MLLSDKHHWRKQRLLSPRKWVINKLSTIGLSFKQTFSGKLIHNALEGKERIICLEEKHIGFFLSASRTEESFKVNVNWLNKGCNKIAQYAWKCKKIYIKRQPLISKPINYHIMICKYELNCRRGLVPP